MKPNFNNCPLNLVASIEKHYGYKLDNFESIEEIDKKLVGKKHIFLIVLDGLGTKIIEKNLKENSFIRTHGYKTMSTLFPSTTACVTVAIQSGHLPNDTGYFGWHQYFKEFGRDIVLFKNQDYYTNERLSTRLPISYKRFYDKYDNISTYSLFPKWDMEHGYKNIHAQMKKMVEIAKSSDETFTYCYYDDPDYIIHNYGTNGKKTRRVIKKIDNELRWLNARLGDESIVFVTADHGLIDTKTIFLEDYPALVEQLELKPSIEARCTTFKVKPGSRFKELFNHYFPTGFELYTKEGFLNSDYIFKTKYENRIEEFIFDYVAVATDKYSFAFTRSKKEFKAAHAGATEDEMLIPLIIFF